MISAPEVLVDATKIAETGDRIYDERWRHQYEPQRNGEFVAIDIQSGEAFLSQEAVDALEQACAANPGSLFHLIRVGRTPLTMVAFFFPSAFSEKLPRWRWTSATAGLRVCRR